MPNPIAREVLRETAHTVDKIQECHVQLSQKGLDAKDRLAIIEVLEDRTRLLASLARTLRPFVRISAASQQPVKQKGVIGDLAQKRQQKARRGTGTSR